jgi:capsular exopolysaccharide synthesis family protein
VKNLNLRDYLRILGKRWILVVALTALGLAVGLTMTALTPPVYQANAQLFVSVQAGTDVSDLNQGNSFSQQRVRSYADIVTSPRVTQPVVRQLGLAITPDQLAGQISAEAPANTVLINIAARDRVPAQAAKIADAVARRFSVVVEELERPDGSEKAPVRLGITQQARVPDTPVAPKPLVNLALGLVAGMSLGVGLAVLRETLDTSVKSSQDLTRAAQVPTLGTIVFDRQTTMNTVATDADPHGSRAEAFRQLRTNLRFVDVDNQPRLIVVTSPVSNEGKTSTAINLAASLVEAGTSVCLIDGDLRRPSVAKALGLVHDAGLTSVLIGQAGLEQVMQRAGPNFAVLTSGPIPPNPSELLASVQMGLLLQEAAKLYDIVIVDTPPLLPVTDGAVLASQADGALLVVRTGKTTRDQVARAADTLHKVGARVLGGVLNMAPTKGPQSYGYGYVSDYRPSRPEESRGWRRTRSAGRPSQDEKKGRAEILAGDRERQG